MKPLVPKTGIIMPTRRKLLGIGAAAAALPLTGCEAFDSLADRESPVRKVIASANGLTYRVQRMLLGGDQLAKEFTESDIRQEHRANGTDNPEDVEYLRLAADKFAAYRLQVGGMVEKPRAFSLPELKSMPARTQITRHDCVEGWSSIAKWTGVPLATVLDQVGVKGSARFAVFECFDDYGQGLSGKVKYYESIDLIDARHPQTILAFGMNGKDLPIANGAPLRVRVERQLGYKMAKYLKKITLVDDLSPFGDGNGSFWADNGYDWYAGI